MTICGLFFFLLNAKFSEEFTGGVSISLISQSSPESLQIALHNFLDKNNYPTTISIDQAGDTLTIKMNATLDSDAQVAELSDMVKQFLLDEKIVNSTDEIIGQVVIGPSVGEYMKTSAIQAFMAGLVLMVIYILFSFGKIRKDIPAQILAFTTLAVLLFEVSLCFGAYGLWMMTNETILVDTVFIIAILTVCGYGVNDIIIIFDRVRENLLKKRGTNSVVVEDVIEDSLWQTMKRSIGTSLSTLLVLIAMRVFGTGVLREFAFTVGIGVIATAFASIFLGGSLTFILMKLQKKTKNNK
ncbi:hypothetical protein AGMMS50249_7400 [candidate division SR1 bacterium]|nr:hypothetical protein AGMMS50249_7400 [candidate division SR1 bacterium]